MAPSALELTRARSLLRNVLSARASVALAYHADADGIASAALGAAALERAGGTIAPLTPEKGHNIYDERFRRALDALGAGAALMLDTGSRANGAFGSTPTIVVDHHPTADRPRVHAFVHDDESPATTLLTLELVAPLAPLDDRHWLVALGILGDSGGRAIDHPILSAARSRFGAQPLREVVALINASGRAAHPEPEVALSALRRADDPRSIVHGESSEARRLHALRREVTAALAHARRVAPRVRGRFAIIEIASGCRIHGVLAAAWAKRLAPRIVLVSNRGYTPGRIHLSVRSHAPHDLRAELRALLPHAGPDYAAGHARASGAILDEGTYAELLHAIDQAA